MSEKYIFKREFNLEEKFLYVTSSASKSKNKFLQEENAIVNSYNKEIEDYDYISIITRKRYGIGTTIKVSCSFEKFGAPLIVLTDDYREKSDGSYEYGLHFEVVAYEGGCNVWHIEPGKKENPIEVTKINSMEFSIEEKSRIDLEVRIEDKKLFISVNNKILVAEHKDFPSMMHVGITACEGVNRFYEMEILQE